MSQTEARYTIRTLLAIVVVTILVTVMSLEISGKIKHTDNKDDAEVGEFKAIHITPDGDGVRMSPKSSELHAVCEQNYLAIASDVDPAFRALLVDYKNRGVRCGDIHTVVDSEVTAAPGQDASHD